MSQDKPIERHQHLFATYGCWCGAKRYEQIVPKWFLRLCAWWQGKRSER